MIDFAQVFLFWENVFGIKAVGDGAGANSWVHSTITSSALYQTEMMNHFTRESVRKNHGSPSDRRLALQFYNLAITSVRETMQDPATALSNACIFAVANLTMHPPLMDIRRSDPSSPHPSQGPLNSLLYLDVYGGPLGVVPAHRRGLLRMIELRGGIRKAGLEDAAFPLSQ